MKRVSSSSSGLVADKKQRSSGDKLCVALLNGESVEVAYGEEEKRMAFWEFLSTRLYPAFKGMMYWDAEEVSLRGARFLYNHKGPATVDMVGPETVVVGEGQQFAFNYENRLLKMGQIICDRSNYVLHGVRELGLGGVAMADGHGEYVGNAVERDSRVECCVCLDISPGWCGGNGLTDFCLGGCKHRFHRKCVGALTKPECPLCRQGFDFRDLVLFAFFQSVGAPRRIPVPEAPPPPRIPAQAPPRIPAQAARSAAEMRQASASAARARARALADVP